ncbi:MSCRAMM family protein [Microbacterium sp. TWP3-1-2b2]|uniref:MSCRAMM family protein n=1 Tax=Microbacterium sp. TWP3-1-2b2 TaxID=2804651 RepID=UPI003CFAD841
MRSRRTNRRWPVRALLAGTAAAVMALGGGIPAVADDEEATSIISGTVTREADGTPVEGVGVFVSDTAGGFSYNGSSDANGDYSVTDLPSGEYVVRFDPAGSAPELISEYWNDAIDWMSAERIVTVGGETVSDVDASLQLGGSIVGSVTREADGTPVEGAAVELWAVDGSGSGTTAWTQPDGTFRADGLRAGDYTARFDAPAGSGLTTEYWDDAADSTAATPVPVMLGETTTNIDAALAEAAVISGHVSREADGTPVEGSVEVYAVGDARFPTATVDLNGDYSVDVAPGSYILRFRPFDERLFEEFWDDATLVEDATPVTVAAGERRSAIDAELVAGTSIGGTVHAGGEPLADASVSAYAGDRLAGSSITAPDGSYSITLPVGSYVLEARASAADPVFAVEYYEDAATAGDAKPVDLGPDEDLVGIDFDLDLGVDIRGTVTLAGAGEPDGEGATVIAYRWGADGWIEAARTPSWGAFAFSADPTRDGGPLRAGRYTFGVEMPGYCTHYLGGAVSLDDAESLDLEPGDTAKGSDVTLTAECEGPEPTAELTLSVDAVRAGDAVTVAGAGFTPGAKVTFELHSDPIRLGTLQADADGLLGGTLRIPASAPAGKHTLVAMAGSSVIASAALEVTAAQQSGVGSGGAETPDGGLASTGADVPALAAAFAVVLVVVGGLLMLRRRTVS